MSEREYEVDGKAPMKANTDTKEIIENFIVALTDLEVSKQNVMEQIKDLKGDYKDEGIAVSLITSIFNVVKKNKKKSDSERFEEETIREWLEGSKKVDDAIMKVSK